MRDSLERKVQGKESGRKGEEEDFLLNPDENDHHGQKLFFLILLPFILTLSSTVHLWICLSLPFTSLISYKRRRSKSLSLRENLDHLNPFFNSCHPSLPHHQGFQKLFPFFHSETRTTEDTRAYFSSSSSPSLFF